VAQPGAQSSGAATASPMAVGDEAVVGIEGDSTIEYTPSAGFSGTATLRYVISDGRAESQPAIISVAVAASNQAPDASPDRAETPVDTPVDVNVLANDEDPDNIPNSLLPRPIPLTIASIDDGPGQGAARIVCAPGEQQIRYDPNVGFSGIDSFSYTAFDGLSASPVPGIVTVRVGEVTFAALPDQGSTDEATPIVIDVLANDEFDRTAPFELALGQLTPDRGVIRVNLDDTVTFDPDGFDALEDGDQAQVTFEYALIQAGMSSTAEVSVIVAGATAPPPPNIPPTLTVDARILPTGELPFPFETTQPFPGANGVEPDDLTLDLDPHRQHRVSKLRGGLRQQPRLVCHRGRPAGRSTTPVRRCQHRRTGDDHGSRTAAGRHGARLLLDSGRFQPKPRARRSGRRARVPPWARRHAAAVPRRWRAARFDRGRRAAHGRCAQSGRRDSNRIGAEHRGERPVDRLRGQGARRSLTELR
jgi:hypothetical protein